MNIDLFTYSDMGARQLNEDSFDLKNEENRCTAVLCDGLGGYNCGEVASRFAARNITEGIAKLGELSDVAIQSILKQVNDALIVYQNENAEQRGMRTTAVGCIIDKNNLTYFNCGDSRFYFFSDGVMKTMSKDHSVSQMSVDLGEMSFSDIRSDVNKNKLLKVLGENSGGETGTVYRPLSYKKGDAFLLCSDGFWEHVTEEEMEIDLSKSKSAKEWLEFMLVRVFLKFNGDNDNFTVIGGIIN